MGKPTEDKTREKDETKVLFKKSSNSIFTHSRTCSGTSQFASKSGVHVRSVQKSKETNCYSEKDKSKRDFSVETDVCVLRRYYRSKKYKMLSTKQSPSRYSTVIDTEVETIAEYPDSSACGDNEIVEEASKHPVDIEALLIDNLKGLLNQWFQKHVLNNKDTEQKLETVFNALLHKLDDKAERDTSVERMHKCDLFKKMKKKKMPRTFITCQPCEQKLRRYTESIASSISQKGSNSSIILRTSHKDVRIISTLSVSRNYNKHIKAKVNKNDSVSNFTPRKIKPKHVTISFDKSSEIINSSSFDLLAISKKPHAAKCSNDINAKRIRHIVFLPKTSYMRNDPNTNAVQIEDALISDFKPDNTQIEEMPSLLQSIFTENPVIVNSSTDKNGHDNNQTGNLISAANVSSGIVRLNSSKTNIYLENYPKQVNECNQFDSHVEEDGIGRSIEILHKTTYTNTSRNKTQFDNYCKTPAGRGKVNKRRKRVFGNKMPYVKVNNMSQKQFSARYKNINLEEDITTYRHQELQYFAEYDSNRNINLDIIINLFPMSDHKTKDVYTNISSQTFKECDINRSLFCVKPVVLDSRACAQTSLKLPCNAAPDTGTNNGPTAETSNTYVTTKFKSEVYMQPTTIDVEAAKAVSPCSPEIIPLLDGSVSEAKYIVDVIQERKPNSCTVTNESDILHEVSELRAVVKNLATTTEKLMNEQLKNQKGKQPMVNAEAYVIPYTNDNYTSTKSIAKFNDSKILNSLSIGTQVSTDFEKRPATLATENSKQSSTDFYRRLLKKSTSYRIIDSESILKVHDMTSKANEINECNHTDQALTCSFPKSRSVFEMTTERNKKLIAFFCDNCVTPKPKYKVRSMCQIPSCRSACYPLPSSTDNCKWKKCLFGKKKRPKSSKVECACYSANPSSCVVPILDECDFSTTMSARCSTNSLNEDDLNENTCKLVPRGMGFGEGCVYCLLLWIPVILILAIFYTKVLSGALKESVNDSKVAHGRDSLSHDNAPETFRLQLADVGF